MWRWATGVLLTVLSIGLLLGFVYLVRPQPRRVPLVLLHVSSYEPPLPPQAYAQEDMDRFAQLFHTSRWSSPVITGTEQHVAPLTVSTGQEFLTAVADRIGQVKPGGPNNDVVLVYLSAQGFVNSEGMPCILAAAPASLAKGRGNVPIPAEILAKERQVPIAELLKTVKDGHPGAWKVVLLDCVRWDRNWRLGIPRNDFASALEKEMRKLAPTDRVVLINSCGVDGEVSLVDPGQQRTLFGDYVARGLAGEADSSATDGSLTLSEFKDYLSWTIGDTAKRRSRVQQPLILTPGNQPLKAELALARTQDAPLPGRDGNAAETIRKELTSTTMSAKWKQASSGSDGHPEARLVVPVEKFRQELLRFESLLLAGKAYDEATTTEPAFSDSLPPTKASPPPTVTLPLSLPEAYGLPPDEQQQATWAASYGPIPTDQPDPVTKLAQHERLYGLWSSLQSSDRTAPVENRLTRAQLLELAVLPVELRSWVRFSAGNTYLPKSASDEVRAALLECRMLAERAAFAGGDPRAYSWIAPLVQSGDARRRDAEDRAFAGGDAGDVLKQLAEAKEAYAQAEERAAVVTRAYAARDRALAELPYWLEWTCVDESRRALGQSLVDHSAKVTQLLNAMGEREASYSALQTAQQNLQTTLASLDGSLQQSINTCRVKGLHLGYLVQLENLLSMPLVGAEDRANLWTNYFSVLAQEKDDAGEGTSGGKDGGKSAQAEADATTAAIGSSPPGKARAAAEEMMQRWLQSLGEQASFVALTDKARAELTKGETDFSTRGPELRAGLDQADAMLRGFSPWLSLVRVKSLERYHRHGAILHQECARHDYYCAQAQRFLDDFLANGDDFATGSAAGSLPRLAGIDRTGEPYFSLTAGNLFNAADALFPQETAAAREHLRQRLLASRMLSQHVEQRLQELSNDPVGPDKPTVTLPIQPGAPLLKDVPQGLAALHIAGGEGAVSESGLSVALVAADAPPKEYVQLKIPGPWAPSVLPPQVTLARRPEPWQLTFYYRGHTGTKLNFEFAPPQPGHLIKSRRAGDTGRVTVQSHRTRGSVVIVLDCSKSMQGNVFKDACKAIQATIVELRRTPGMHISLVAFAHRRGIDKHPTREVPGKYALSWNEYFNPEDPTIALSNDYREEWNSKQDVESLAPLLTGGLKPMGATPLYDSVAYAATNAFPPGSPSRHLIILTDGVDSMPPNEDPDRDDETFGMLFDPPWDGLYNSDTKRGNRERAVVKAIKDARLDSLLLFDLTRTQALQGVANLLKAELVPIDNTDILSRQIQQRIGIFEYRIAERGDTRQEGRTAQTEEFTLPVGEYTMDLIGSSASKAPFDIRGDEHLSVRIDLGKDGPQIAFLDFDESARNNLLPNAKLADAEAERLAGNKLYPVEYHVSGSAEGFVVGRTSRKFSLTLRSVEPGRFTPRPREVWVEVIPAQRSGTEPAKLLTDREPYFFANPSFRADTPVPVLELDAPNWPADATAAVVNVWFRMTESTGGVRLTADGELRPASLASKWGIKVDRQDKPLPTGQGWAIDVSERHSATGSGQPPWCYVELEGLRADAVERQFYPADGRVNHRFIFADASLETLSRKAITIVSQEDWKKSAAIVEPLTIAVPQQ